MHKPGPFGIVLYALLACAAILAIGTTVQRYTTHATIFVPPAMTHHAKPITQ